MDEEEATAIEPQKAVPAARANPAPTDTRRNAIERKMPDLRCSYHGHSNGGGPCVRDQHHYPGKLAGLFQNPKMLLEHQK